MNGDHPEDDAACAIVEQQGGYGPLLWQFTLRRRWHITAVD